MGLAGIFRLLPQVARIVLIPIVNEAEAALTAVLLPSAEAGLPGRRLNLRVGERLPKSALPLHCRAEGC